MLGPSLVRRIRCARYLCAAPVHAAGMDPMEKGGGEGLTMRRVGPRRGRGRTGRRGEHLLLQHAYGRGSVAASPGGHLPVRDPPGGRAGRCCGPRPGCPGVREYPSKILSSGDGG